ncbi:hypothetical protein M951_chr329 (nucleomorph) [Lotharella oceanica]|nr:hypothetical protein M951_chr329 [Lotharella oceanica]
MQPFKILERDNIRRKMKDTFNKVLKDMISKLDAKKAVMKALKEAERLAAIAVRLAKQEAEKAARLTQEQAKKLLATKEGKIGVAAMNAVLEKSSPGFKASASDGRIHGICERI